MIQKVTPVEEQILTALRRIIRAVDLHSRKLLDQYGLTGPQLMVLSRVDRLEDPSMTALAQEIHLSRPTVAGILDRLTRRGLVTRVPHPRDRRAQQIALTEAGRGILAKAPSLLQERFREQLAALEDWEQSQMLATLQRLAAMMDAQDISAAPMLTAGSVNDGDLPSPLEHSEPN